MLLDRVVTSVLANKTWTFVNDVFTTERRTPTVAHASLNPGAIKKKRDYTYLRILCQMMLVGSRMLVFCFELIGKCIMTVSLNILMRIPATQKLTGKMSVSIQRNLQLRHRLMVLHTWTAVLPARQLFRNHQR